MKKLIYTLFAIAAMVLSSCSNKVDLYADDGEHTVVYAMLDAGADTNFFKITKSFIGNVDELAQNYEESNYKKEDLDVKFSGVFVGNNNVQTITLDTISKWVPYDGSTPFYSGRYQTYYYTTEKLKQGEEYQISITRKSDGVKITAKTETISDFSFKKPMANEYLNLNLKKKTIEWEVRDVTTNFMSNAAYFEVTAFFHYKELQPGATDTVHRSMRWPLASDKAENLFTSYNNSSYYMITFTPDVFFTMLANDNYLKNNSPAGVQRWYEDGLFCFEIRISAIGEELYNYYIVANSTSAIQDVPNFTNVENGIGIVSSRYNKSQTNRINRLTRNRIEADFPQYGFVTDPNPQ